MKNSRSDEWGTIRRLEDQLARLAALDQERRLIKRRAWELGDLETYAASERQLEELIALKRDLSTLWRLLTDAASE